MADLHQRRLTESMLLAADDGGLRGFVRRYYWKANAASVDDSGSPSSEGRGCLLAAFREKTMQRLCR